MEQPEFDNTEFGAGMKCRYNDVEFEVGSVDFQERLIGLVCENTDDLIWVRCENTIFIL